MSVGQDGPAPPYLTSDRASFAYVSASQRWPVILTGAVDDVHRSIFETDDEAKQKEGKGILESLAKLKYELQHNRPLTPLEDDGGADIADYNKSLEGLEAPTWLSVPWLFAECSLYRRIQTYLSKSTHWRSYDVFSRQKLSTFKSSRPAILELATRYKMLIAQMGEDAKVKEPSRGKEEKERILFTEMCEICLWGNATDLSLLTSLTYEDIQKLQGSEARKSAEANILVNDLPAAYEALREAQNEGKQVRTVDIVLDNAGFELFVDLVLAGYLLESGLATQIVLHPKSMPWFVSDVIAADFQTLLNVLAAPQDFFRTEMDGEAAKEALSGEEADKLKFLFEHWSGLYAEGQLIIRPNAFWTTEHDFWSLPNKAQRLMEDFKESELVIFKGDLNYRKLTADAMWPTTTPFSTAIGPLGAASGIRTLALRTCKSDTVVGLKDGEDERLQEEVGEGIGRRKWAWNGKYAVVQFCDGKRVLR